MTTIFLFSDNYPYGSGETFLANELPYLAQSVDYVRITPMWANGDKRQNAFANVKIEEPILGFNPKKKLRLFMSGVFNLSPFISVIKELRAAKAVKNHANCSLRKKLWKIFTSILLTRSILASKNFKKVVESMTSKDLCYSYWGYNTANALALMKKKNHAFPKSISRFHNSDLYHEAKGYIPFRNQLFDALDMICTISQHGADYLTGIYPQIKNKICVSRLGSGDHGIQNYSKTEEFRILTCSNIVVIKRLDILANALKQITNKKISWTHIGGGPLKKQVLEITKSYGDNITVDFKGVMQNSELLEFIKNSSFDVFVNTSLSEGIPVSIMEAISFGIPVIATDVGGTSEIVNQNTGLLISKEITPEQLKDIILDFSNLDDDKIQQLRTSTREEWQAHWNMDVNYRKFMETITNLN